MRKFTTYQFSPNGNHVLLQLDARGEAQVLETTPDGRVVRNVKLLVDSLRARALIEAAPRTIAAMDNIGGQLVIGHGRGGVPVREAATHRDLVSPEVEVFCRQMESLAQMVAQHGTPADKSQRVQQQAPQAPQAQPAPRTREWDNASLGAWSILFFVVHLLAFGLGSLGYELALTASGTLATIAGAASMLIAGGAAHYALGSLFGRAYPTTVVSWQPSLVSVLLLIALFFIAGNGIEAVVWSTLSFPIFATLGQWARSESPSIDVTAVTQV